MKKTLLISGVLLAFSAATAAAAGLNLSWDDCLASVSGGLNKTSTCASNFESFKVLQGSFILPSGSVAVNGNGITLDAQTATDPLPCWWNMTAANPPRAAGFVFAFNTPTPACADYWGSIPGGPTGSGAAEIIGSNRIRFKGVVAIDAFAAQPLPADLEFYSFSFRLQFANTTTCAGCQTPACFVLQQIDVTQTNAASISLTAPQNRSHVTWQGGVIPGGCPQATPAQSRTWGSVKALYR